MSKNLPTKESLKKFIDDCLKNGYDTDCMCLCCVRCNNDIIPECYDMDNENEDCFDAFKEMIFSNDKDIY